MSKLIYLSNGRVSNVNELDFLYLLNMIPWHLHHNKHAVACYAYKWVQEKDGRRYRIYMHHEVIKRMGLTVPSGCVIDHEDLDGLNNDRFNLRVVDWTQSQLNKGINKNNKTGVTGVNYRNDGNSRTKNWYMQYTKYGERKVKHFFTYEEAVTARLKWESENLS
jgi:hypothetical protein